MSYSGVFIVAWLLVSIVSVSNCRRRIGSAGSNWSGLVE